MHPLTSINFLTVNHAENLTLMENKSYKRYFLSSQFAFDRLYSQASSRDKCTLYSDRNLINRRNVKARVDSAVKPAHSFFTSA